MCVGLRSRCRSYLSATLQGKHPRLLSVTVSHVKSSDTETCRKFAGIGWHLEKTLYKGENQNSHWYNTTNEADIVLTYLPILSIHVIHSYIQISIQRLYLISINFKFWNLSINLFITRISYLQFILIILTKIAYFILTTHVLKTLSIRSLLELLLGKDLSHIKVLSFGKRSPWRTKSHCLYDKIFSKIKRIVY